MYINTDEWEDELPITEDRAAEIAHEILRDYYDEDPEFTLTFVSPERIQELNRTWREKDAVTDVLSFESEGEFDPETGLEYLGDIVICPEQANRQAEQSGHSLANEIALLEIHGLLHLLGYDHLDDAQREEMWKYQDLYLNQCGIQLNRRPGEDFEF